MFDRSGISVEDLVWIHRDQFVHYVQLAYALGDPGDWSHFRQDVLRALTAAFGVGAGTGDEPTSRQQRALQLLDEIRVQHDPAADWPTFFETLWSRRHGIRTDLPLTEPAHRLVPRCQEVRHIRRPPRCNSLMRHARP